MLQTITRVSPQAARYTPAGSPVEHCSLCRFYVARGSNCLRIMGRVSLDGWCKYFSREMVQPWQQPGGYALTGPGGPSLDLDFMNGVMPAGVTFTRASTGTYFNSSGVMQTAATNAPRWDYDPVALTLRGLLIEEARSNICLQSADMSNAVWSVSSITAGSPTVTGNQTTAPDGTLTAARVVYPAVSGAGNASLLFQAIAATANPYALSIYLRGNVGGEQLYFIAEAGATFYKVLVTLTTVWQRFLITTPALTAGTWFIAVGADLRDGAQTGIAAQTIYVWGAQMELGAFPTSYIPTTAAAVTRAYDLCTIPPANMGWFVPPGGSWMTDIISESTTGDYPRIIFGGVGVDQSTSYGPVLWLSTNDSNIGVSYDTSVIIATANSTPMGTSTRVASTYTSGTGRVCLNGGPIASGAQTNGFAILATAGTGMITGTNAGAPLNASGWLRALRYWPRVLADAELQAVTT